MVAEDGLSSVAILVTSLFFSPPPTLVPIRLGKKCQIFLRPPVQGHSSKSIPHDSFTSHILRQILMWFLVPWSEISFPDDDAVTNLFSPDRLKIQLPSCMRLAKTPAIGFSNVLWTGKVQQFIFIITMQQFLELVYQHAIPFSSARQCRIRLPFTYLIVPRNCKNSFALLA